MRQPVLLITFSLVCVAGCKSSSPASESTPTERGETKEVEDAPTDPATKSGAGETKISFRKKEGFHGPVRRVVEDTMGVETVWEFDCAGYPLAVGIAKFEWEFDDQGCAIADKTMMGRSEAECDRAGRRVVERKLGSQGEVEEIFRYKYDPAGHETRRHKQNADGSTIFDITWTYNDHGDPTREEHAAPGEPTEIVTFAYEYGDDGSKIATRTGAGDDSERVTYDAHDHEVRRETLDASGEVSLDKSYVYEVDEHGNWTKKGIGSEDDEPTWMTTRLLEYCDGG